MPRAPDQDNLIRILQLRFRGYSSREVAERVGWSQRTVQNRVNDFIHEVEEVGLMKEHAHRYIVDFLN